jgi:hypothetical protein
MNVVLIPQIKSGVNVWLAMEEDDCSEEKMENT